MKNSKIQLITLICFAPRLETEGNRLLELAKKLNDKNLIFPIYAITDGQYILVGDANKAEITLMRPIINSFKEFVRTSVLEALMRIGLQRFAVLKIEDFSFIDVATTDEIKQKYDLL